MKDKSRWAWRDTATREELALVARLEAEMIALRRQANVLARKRDAVKNRVVQRVKYHVARAVVSNGR